MAHSVCSTCDTLGDVLCMCSGFSASDESAVWIIQCKQVTNEAEPCPAVKYTGVMDRFNLARYFRVRDLPAVVSITRLFLALKHWFNRLKPSFVMWLHFEPSAPECPNVRNKNW